MSAFAINSDNVLVGEQVKALGITQSFGGKDKIVETSLVAKALEHRQIRVKIVAVSVNPVDFKVREGHFGGEVSESEPRVLGYDGAGIVTELGPEASLFKVGDRVFFAGDVTKNGTNSDYSVVDERLVGKMPKSLSFAQAAAVPLVALTAWEGLFEEMQLKAFDESVRGKSILVLPGAGGVGTLVIQLAAKVLGLHVIATASRPETIQMSKDLGAHLVINHRQPLKEQLAEHGLSGVDYIYNAYDTEVYFDQYANIINPFGKILSIVPAKVPLNISALFIKRVSFHWELMFTRSMFNIDMIKQHHILQQVSELIDNKMLVSPAQEPLQYSLENLRAAHEKVESGSAIGKIVLTKEPL